CASCVTSSSRILGRSTTTFRSDRGAKAVRCDLSPWIARSRRQHLPADFPQDRRALPDAPCRWGEQDWPGRVAGGPAGLFKHRADAVGPDRDDHGVGLHDICIDLGAPVWSRNMSTYTATVGWSCKES